MPWRTRVEQSAKKLSLDSTETSSLPLLDQGHVHEDSHCCFAAFWKGRLWRPMSSR
jgi:hypothetical protein